MKEGPAKAFLEYLEANPAVRDVLKDAVLEDIVAQGAARGFLFSATDLSEALKDQKSVKGWPM